MRHTSTIREFYILEQLWLNYNGSVTLGCTEESKGCATQRLELNRAPLEHVLTEYTVTAYATARFTIFAEPAPTIME